MGRKDYPLSRFYRQFLKTDPCIALNGERVIFRVQLGTMGTQV